MRRRNPRVQARNRNLIQMYLVLLLAGRNRILQVLRSCAFDARRISPRDMRKSARHRMLGVMHVVLKGTMKLLVKNLVTFLRNLLLSFRNQDPLGE